MKRILIGILIGGFLTAFLFLWKPSLVGLARERLSVSQEKGPARWETVKDIKVLRLWESNIGPTWPQIALLQLSEQQRIELQSNPLKFYTTYQVFKPYKTDHAQGHFVIRLGEYKAGSADPDVTIAVHDPGTYSGFASFEVDKIEP